MRCITMALRCSSINTRNLDISILMAILAMSVNSAKWPIQACGLLIVQRLILLRLELFFHPRWRLEIYSAIENPVFLETKNSLISAWKALWLFFERSMPQNALVLNAWLFIRLCASLLLARVLQSSLINRHLVFSIVGLFFIQDIVLGLWLWRHRKWFSFRLHF